MKNDPRWQTALYTTETYNEEGLEGHAYVPDGLNLQTSSPLNNHPGTNPEQLLGMSLCTCLVATMQAVEKEHQLEHHAKVRAKIAYIGERAHYEFLVHAQICVPQVDFDRAKKLVAETEKRCCVSQLLSGSKNYSVEAVEDWAK
ncbi:organic hydroperoxide resistance protein [Ligilactobacillus acidipiscis DSM 15836]|uniref:Organic hydroperoxide resistance protein n=1 Tax=Ligilactobacillus acidipiscis DSM 15836 TaxID=1423716 RepID=A0ABR5PHP1_9LACO|nr:OsmC family protein [Ligilactobacillus acidipiscis]KRM20890.1 organic hydroperoxide resistance protein [Ligilactobacillus acidipiscis DSM 15836]GAW63015.1 OsmC/Ohr family protein [Ligilactobacillus acidipiscis]GEN21916.1 dihydroneopterin aldolase [Ligilactobacillus acidipiscis]